MLYKIESYDMNTGEVIISKFIDTFFMYYLVLLDEETFLIYMDTSKYGIRYYCNDGTYRVYDREKFNRDIQYYIDSGSYEVDESLVKRTVL